MEPTRTFQFLGLTFNVSNMISGVIVAVILFAFIFVCSRNLQLKPKGKQNLLEYMIDFTNGIIKSTIGNDAPKKYGLWAFTLFYFILIANLLGLFIHIQVGNIVYVKSPTADPIVALTFSLMSLTFAMYSGVEKLGYKGHFKGFLQPVFLFLPINLLEELTNFLTLGIRVYGNIFAGELLAGIIANLAFSNGLWLVPVAAPLELAWQGFSVFIGCIQAYVFVTLSSVYVSQKLSIEE
ncbi:F0F1 ATP synthase subunit A [Fructilactobacillus fructivorans]|uniref:ATP synthase subunit a n=1 Tax=Fructilactobacillus fructivorans TaxID=1614 RepID=A0A0C1M5V0_9LACO|nr:F0F1 ATP synthase subunit A [Fructilactobacillus fructivorans]KID41599.1 ATP synthase A chain [Fructilactobacillus fructivorans]MCT0151251.1 F0F1 ATP synthase subunit A [Fructilactobacillus fructivorans]MCT2867672.1 F0F1 ATP synthase subunit A [Fructilactobacillus fructivorans]MCT2868810.1 F0F1 ATP synthase subunit A [Fructilactobacillus fructivorans]MCT2874020.1 F0F1 ATP synthase subunit A [Fructilactobacillus fructivorans]